MITQEKTSSEIYNQRLLEFADYLTSKRTRLQKANQLRFVKLVNIMTDQKGNYQEVPLERLYHDWALRLLPELFEEFYIAQDDELYYEDIQGTDYEDGPGGSMIFFDLKNMESFCSLFCVATEDNDDLTGHYNTKRLSRQCSPAEIADNIRAFVGYRKANPLEFCQVDD